MVLECTEEAAESAAKAWERGEGGGSATSRYGR